MGLDTLQSKQQAKKKKKICNKKLGSIHFQWTQCRWFNALPVKRSRQ